jgi:hypothetical protein
VAGSRFDAAPQAERSQAGVRGVARDGDQPIRPKDERPHGFALEAEGDFVGRGAWHFVQLGARVCARYDGRIRATKPRLRLSSFLLKPVCAANHRWAMRRGDVSLRLELRRRRARSERERRRIPAPPAPTIRWLTQRR